MNIAVSTIILFTFLLPGIILRRFYYTEEFSKQFFKQNFFELFVAVIVPSIFLHVLVGSLAYFFNNPIDFRIIGQLLTSKDYPVEAFENIQNNIGKIITYHSIIFSISACIGYISKKIVRSYRIDSKRKIFRFKNAWHYILTGEFFNFHRAAFDLAEDDVEEVDFVVIDVIVDTKEGAVLYDGFLVDYELSQTGGLETITLKNVQRRFLKDDNNNQEEETYYKIPGHISVIPYSTILNLNFSYYKFVEIEGNEEEVEIGFELIK